MNKQTQTLFELNHFTKLTPVQEAILNAPQEKRDLIVQSDTGTGKTHAFLFAISEKMNWELKQTQAIICAPTRELAMQIYDFAKPMQGIEPHISVELAIGGMDGKRLKSKLESQPQIIIGTPGKLLDIVSSNVIRMDTIQTFVIDEMDMMLDYGFMPDIEALSSRVLDQTQFMLFSATLPQSMQSYIKKFLHHPLHIKSDASFMKPQINHILINQKHRDINEMLLDVMSAIQPSLGIIFCNTKKQASEIASFLRTYNVRLVEMHGDIEDRARKQAVRMIENQKIDYIVATDLAARGIDLPEISHVINIGLPSHELEFYTHRVGRTGRSGRDGMAISIVMDSDEKSVRKLMSQGIEFKYMQVNQKHLQEARSFYHTRKRPVTQDGEVSQILNRKKVTVKPGYKKKRQQEIDNLMRRRRREQIRSSIKEQKKQRAIDKQKSGD